MFTRQQVAAACRQYGGLLKSLPNGIDGPQLLWALSGNESRFGEDCVPRHEPGYDVGGRYATHDPMPALRALYGRAAACSYGPWQTMLAYVPGYAPADFADINKAAVATVKFLNADLLRFRPEALCDIGEIWNAGHICPDKAYTDKLDANYLIPMPVGLAPLQSA